MTGFHDLARTRQLKHNRVTRYFVAGPSGANAKLQISLSEDLFRFKSVFSDHVRDFHFRAAQRKIDGRRHSEEKNKSNRNDDCDTADGRQNSGNYTHKLRSLALLLKDPNKEPIRSLAVWPGPECFHRPETIIVPEHLFNHILILFAFDRAR